MKKNKVIFNILVIVSFFVIAYLLAQKVFQNDTYYTIKVGESFFKNGVDMKDHFSFIPNLTYVYPHWLYDSFIYLMYSIGGFTLIYLSTIALGFTLLFMTYQFSVKLGNNKYVSYLLIMFFSFFLEGYFTARAQMFSYIFFVIILYSLEMLRNTKKKRYFIYLFISSWMIANMHAAVWPFVFVLFLPSIAQDVISVIKNIFKLKFLDTFNFEIEDNKIIITMIAFVLCLLTGFLTPNFLVPFTYFIKTASGISMNYISEHGPITIKSYWYVYLFLLGTLVILLNKKVKIKLKDLFLILGLFIVAFSSIKNISLLFILSIFVYSRIFSSFKYDGIESYLWNKYFICALLILFSITFAVAFKTYGKKDYVNEKLYPVQACDYILENLDVENIKIFNQYDFGSYMLYREIPVFIDSRADLYLKEFNKDCYVFEDYFDAKNNSTYRYVFNKYGITHLLLRNNTQLYYTITDYENYNVLYKDDYFTLFELGD